MRRGTKQLRVILRYKHGGGLAICWGHYKVRLSSVDNVQLFSGIILMMAQLSMRQYCSVLSSWIPLAD